MKKLIKKQRNKDKQLANEKVIKNQKDKIKFLLSR